jgi:tetratricopeptide (TPR) repeat protein
MIGYQDSYVPASPLDPAMPSPTRFDPTTKGCFALLLCSLLIITALGANYAPLAQAQSSAKSTAGARAAATTAPATTTYLAQAFQLYQAKRYAEASNLFYQATQKEGAGASGYLYMAHCQYALGHVKEALPYYRYVKDTYKDSPEAKLALQYLTKLGGGSQTTGTAAGSSGAGAGAAATTGADSTSALPGNLVDRLELVRPKIGHPELSKYTIGTIKDDLNKLPRAVQKILLDGGIKFCLTTTLIDKFPAFGYQEGRGYDGATYKACPGMFWKDTVYICERTVNEATDLVSPEIQSGQMTQTFYHEIGHALDACLDDYSLKDEYRHCYYLDIANIPPDAANRLAYFMQKSDAGQKESCGEITAVCMGSGERHAADIKTYFPLTMAFIKKKLNIDAMLKDIGSK